MNISWGYKIAVLYIGFILLIGIMVFMSMRQKIDLVSEDYYEKELAFQSKIIEMNNVSSLSENISHKITSEEIILDFPEDFKNSSLKGIINFFRPSDSSKDFKISIQLNDLSVHIPLNKFTRGMYKLQVSWTANSIPYFTEEIIVIP
jgi:hypothetical protein